MDRKKLDDYRSKKAEIREIQYRLVHLGEGDSLIGNDVIMDYKKGYPRPQSVVGYDYDKEEKIRESGEKRIAKLRWECEGIENWVNKIPDSITRRIFKIYFIDGDEKVTQDYVGRKMHMERSNVSKKIDKYLKVSHNSQNSHL